MDGIPFGLQDQAATPDITVERRQLERHEFGAKILKHVQASIKGRADLRTGACAELFEDSKAKAFDAFSQIGAQIGRRMRYAARIVRVVRDQRLHDDGIVGVRACQHTDMVERERQRERSRAADRTICRLHTGNPAGGSRIADRAAGIGTKRHRREPCGHSHTRAAGRPSGMTSPVPGIASRRPRQIERRPAGCEFVERRLSDQDSARFSQTPDHKSVARRDMAQPHPGMRRRRLPRDVEDILERNRNTMQHPAPLPLPDLAFRHPRRSQRLVTIH